MAHNKPNKLLILQCFDTVGWATGRASGKKLGVGSDDLTGCLIAPVVTTTSIILSSIQSRIETF